MAVPILPYSVGHYNSLPELHAARNQFESTQASEILFTEIGEALLKHNVEKKLGVVLLHNHFLLEPYEILVNVGSVAVPWDARSGAEELTNVTPSSWRFIDGGLTPFEFAHAATNMLLDQQQTQAFLVEFGAILNKLRLANLFGICALGGRSIDGPTTMEFTSGRANITLPFDIAPDDGNTVDAMWQFSSDSRTSAVQSSSNGMQPIVFGQCKNRCKGKPHQERHTSNT
ncbi:MAG: N-acetyl-glucosamine-6-phosphate deacetylase [Chaenotheca gracillima]|nr:MAG: N-acetyl-glucosamine-6-phosphate deacetylase [Chaenotheca gracillima]